MNTFDEAAARATFQSAFYRLLDSDCISTANQLNATTDAALDRIVELERQLAEVRVACLAVVEVCDKSPPMEFLRRMPRACELCRKTGERT